MAIPTQTIEFETMCFYPKIMTFGHFSAALLCAVLQIQSPYRNADQPYDQIMMLNWANCLKTRVSTAEIQLFSNAAVNQQLKNTMNGYTTDTFGFAFQGQIEIFRRTVILRLQEFLDDGGSLWRDLQAIAIRYSWKRLILSIHSSLKWKWISFSIQFSFQVKNFLKYQINKTTSVGGAQIPASSSSPGLPSKHSACD